LTRKKALLKGEKTERVAEETSHFRLNKVTSLFWRVKKQNEFS